MPVLQSCADVKVTDMFISVDRFKVARLPGKTAVMEVGEEFGIKVLPSSPCRISANTCPIRPSMRTCCR